MRRKSIILSLPSLVLLAVLFSTLGLDMIQHGGRAFSPGQLSGSRSESTLTGGFTSHSDFENECTRCHQPLRVRQAELCLGCHKDVREEVKLLSGTHGMISEVFTCYACHSDHNGEEFDPIESAMMKYDHSIAPFSLRWHQVGYDTLPMRCEHCHKTTPEFGFNLESCKDCHAKHQPEFMEQHRSDFGVNCAECHDGVDRMTDFDHQNTTFPLEGKHIEVHCAACHQDAEFETTSLDCSGCHAEPAAHQDQFEMNCSTCHNAESWTIALLDGQPFEHENATGFSLVLHRFDFSGKELSCKGCHTLRGFELSVDVCATCHTSQSPEFMETHITQFGESCLKCHDGVDRLSDFDHGIRFPLDGRHAEIECESCHKDHVFRDIPSECSQCHAEPEIHAGFFGLECEYCHLANGWIPAELRMHPFPLDHGEDQAQECQVCHIQVYQEYRCYGCHEHQPDEITESHMELNISPSEILDCSSCHPYGEIEPEGE